MMAISFRRFGSDRSEPTTLRATASGVSTRSTTPGQRWQAAAAWLSGQTPPKHEDNEQTINELRTRIRKTVAFAESVKEAQYATASERKVKLSWAPGKVIGGEDYLLQMTIPNTFFHIAMAYAILRHNGVDVGKMDFLGPINLVDA
jgi:hypothetical protein